MAVRTRKLKTVFPDSFFSLPKVVSPYSQNTHNNNFLNRQTPNIEDKEYKRGRKCYSSMNIFM